VRLGREAIGCLGEEEEGKRERRRIMVRRKGLLVLASLVVALLLTAAPSGAQEGTSDKWEFTVTPYMWLAGLEGDMTAEGTKSDVDLSFSDIWDILDIGGAVHLEAWKGDWGLFLDPTYMKLATDERIGDIKVDVEAELWIVEFGAYRRILETPIGTDLDRSLTVDAYAGGRYWYLGNEIDIKNTPYEFDDSEDWLDPIVGSHIRAGLTDKVFLAFRGDVGGFGISSDFTWSTLATVGYQLNPKLTLHGGYRALGIDYSDGSGASKFGMNATMHGPIVGLSIRF
jgi:hypothetical protein